MLRQRLLLATCSYFLLVGQTATPTVYSIPIKNPSFEDPVTANGSQKGNYEESYPCGNFFYPNVPGWTSGQTSWAGAGVWKVIDPTQCTFASPPDGTSIVAVRFFDGFPTPDVHSATISQDLGSVYSLLPHVGGTFRLTFQVADMFYRQGWYPGVYGASLSLKAIPNSTDPVPIYPQTLCQTSGIANGEWTEIPLVCPSPPRYGELILTLSSLSSDWGVVFDKTSLQFTTVE